MLIGEQKRLMRMGFASEASRPHIIENLLSQATENIKFTVSEEILNFLDIWESYSDYCYFSHLLAFISSCYLDQIGNVEPKPPSICFGPDSLPQFISQNWYKNHMHMVSSCLNYKYYILHSFIVSPNSLRISLPVQQLSKVPLNFPKFTTPFNPRSLMNSQHF